MTGDTAWLMVGFVLASTLAIGSSVAGNRSVNATAGLEVTVVGSKVRRGRGLAVTLGLGNAGAFKVAPLPTALFPIKYEEI